MLFILIGPSGYPLNANIILSSSSLTFEWQRLECFEENGPITGYEYRVYYNLVDYIKGVVAKNITQLTVMHTNVQAFSVAAINEAGIGRHSPPVQIPGFELGNNKNSCIKKSFVCLYTYICMFYFPQTCRSQFIWAQF